MTSNCSICNWNTDTILFNDKEYHKSFETLSTGYNHVINPNCYNTVYVCYQCLITDVYMCDTKGKYDFLQELKLLAAVRMIQKWWVNILYNIDTKPGKKFISQKISNSTRTFFNFN